MLVTDLLCTETIMKVHPLVSCCSSLREWKPKDPHPHHHLSPFLDSLSLSPQPFSHPFIAVSSGFKLCTITLITEAPSYLLMLFLAAFPAQHFGICPVLRLCQDSSRQLAVSHAEDGPLRRLTAGVIGLLMHRVPAPFLGKEILFCCVCV